MSPYKCVNFYIQQSISCEDIAFHENTMGPMYWFFRSTLYATSYWGHHYVTTVVCDRLLDFEALIPLFILLTLWRVWVCPPRPYTCHVFFVSHPWIGTNINTKTKSHCVSSEEVPLLHRSLHYPNNPMMSVGHMMSSCPHTSGGNMLTQKIAHLALHGLNHIHTSFSYHFSLTFDLHNYGLPSFSLKKGQKSSQKS